MSSALLDTLARGPDGGNLLGGQGTKRLSNQVGVGADHRLPAYRFHNIRSMPINTNKEFKYIKMIHMCTDKSSESASMQCYYSTKVIFVSLNAVLLQ